MIGLQSLYQFRPAWFLQPWSSGFGLSPAGARPGEKRQAVLVVLVISAAPLPALGRAVNEVADVLMLRMV